MSSIRHISFKFTTKNHDMHAWTRGYSLTAYTHVVLYTYYLDIVIHNMFCVHCGAKMDNNHKFCPECGKPTAKPESDAIVDNTGTPMESESAKISEKMYFEGDGELIVKKIEHRGAGRKIGSWLVGGPVGYVAFGRDKTQKSKAKGRLVVTEKAIYCAGNTYEFQNILSLARIGTMHKSILVNFQNDVAGQRYDIKLEIRTKEMDRLFAALESARTSKIGF